MLYGFECWAIKKQYIKISDKNENAKMDEGQYTKEENKKWVYP